MTSSAMPACALLTRLDGLPLHVQLMLALIVGSGLTCLAVAAGGALRARWRHLSCPTEEPPPLPHSFPQLCDQLYTAIFLAFILWNAAASMLSTTSPPAEQGTLGWRALLVGLAVQLGLYLPMLLRYACVHPWHRPTQPWWHYFVQPVLMWAAIYLGMLLLEVCGFSAWLVRVTGCPEHQNLVMLFGQGDEMQRLYIIICAVLIAPVAEECCFRGFLYRTLRHHSGCMAATLASALLFGAVHSSLAQMAPLTLFGVLQCIAFEKTRSLWLPIATHMLFNTTSLIAMAVLHP